MTTVRDNQEIIPGNYTIERVADPQVLLNDWKAAWIPGFPDSNDREPDELLLERLNNGEYFFLLRDETGKPAGACLLQVQLDDKGLPKDIYDFTAIYDPWITTLPELRNQKIGTDFEREITKYVMQDVQQKRAEAGLPPTKGFVTLLDIEDSKRLIEHDVYGPKGSAESIEFAENADRRQNYWMRQGFSVVKDERLEYVRAKSDREYDPSNPEHLADKQSFIQAWDDMSIRFETESLLAENSRRGEDGQQEVSIDFARQCYISMQLIQDDNPPADPSLTIEQRVEALRHSNPAVDHYIRELDALKANGVEWIKAKDAQWLELERTPPVPRHNMTMAESRTQPYYAHNAEADGPQPTQSLEPVRKSFGLASVGSWFRKTFFGSANRAGATVAAGTLAGALALAAANGEFKDGSSSQPTPVDAGRDKDGHVMTLSSQEMRRGGMTASTPVQQIQMSTQAQVTQIVEGVFPSGIPADIREMISDIVDGGSRTVNAQAIMNLQERLATDGKLSTDGVGFALVAKALEMDPSNVNAQMAVLEMRLGMGGNHYGAPPVTSSEDLRGLHQLSIQLEPHIPSGKQNRYLQINLALGQMKNAPALEARQ